eukprot:sb/3464688/
MRKTLFACFLLLCCVVVIMVAQTLYMQSEAVSENRSNTGDISRGGFVDTLKYYIFLPRTKIQLFIRHLRRKFKKQPNQNHYEQPDLKSVIAGLTLYMQSEAVSENRSNTGDISRGGFVDTLKYYIFLPRTKIQLFIRHLRRKFKKQPNQNHYEQPDLKSEPSDTSKKLITTRYLGHVTGYQPIRDQYFLIRSVPDLTLKRSYLNDINLRREYIKYLVFVISAPNKRSTRDLIRTKGYWAHNWTDSDTGLPVDWKGFFVVGQNADENMNEAVRQEAAENPDLLVGGFDDSYKNLVFKTLWLIEWAANTYDFDVMVKCDDDTIIVEWFDLVDYFFVLEWHGFYGGVRFGGMPVFRNGRYQVTKEEWEPDRFPPYCSGGGYSLNRQAIMKLLEVHYSGVQPLFLVEDAFIGVLAYHAKGLTLGLTQGLKVMWDVSREVFHHACRDVSM